MLGWAHVLAQGAWGGAEAGQPPQPATLLLHCRHNKRKHFIKQFFGIVNRWVPALDAGMIQVNTQASGRLSWACRLLLP